MPHKQANRGQTDNLVSSVRQLCPNLLIRFKPLLDGADNNRPNFALSQLLHYFTTCVVTKHILQTLHITILAYNTCAQHKLHVHNTAVPCPVPGSIMTRLRLFNTRGEIWLVSSRPENLFHLVISWQVSRGLSLARIYVYTTTRVHKTREMQIFDDVIFPYGTTCFIVCLFLKNFHFWYVLGVFSCFFGNGLRFLCCIQCIKTVCPPPSLGPYPLLSILIRFL